MFPSAFAFKKGEGRACCGDGGEEEEEDGGSKEIWHPRERETLAERRERERETQGGEERVFNVKIRAIVRKGRKRPKTGLAQRTLLPSAASSQVHILSVSCGCRQTRKERARGGHRTGRGGGKPEGKKRQGCT